MTVVIDGTTGIDTVQDGAIVAADIAAGAVTQTKLASGVAGNGPALRVIRTTSQTGLSSGVGTKLQLNSVVFDTASCYDATTNYRFTPNVAGYYLATLVAYFTGTGLNGATVIIYKNGAGVQEGSSSSVTAATAAVATGLIYLNGTTDYLEAYGYGTTTSGTITANANATGQYFNFTVGLVRAA